MCRIRPNPALPSPDRRPRIRRRTPAKRLRLAESARKPTASALLLRRWFCEHGTRGTRSGTQDHQPSIPIVLPLARLAAERSIDRGRRQSLRQSGAANCLPQRPGRAAGSGLCSIRNGRGMTVQLFPGQFQGDRAWLGVLLEENNKDQGPGQTFQNQSNQNHAGTERPAYEKPE